MLLGLLLVCIFFNFSVCPVWWTKLAGYTSAFYCMLNTQYRIVMKIDQLSLVSMFLRVAKLTMSAARSLLSLQVTRTFPD